MRTFAACFGGQHDMTQRQRRRRRLASFSATPSFKMVNLLVKITSRKRRKLQDPYRRAPTAAPEAQGRGVPSDFCDWKQNWNQVDSGL